MVNLTDTHCHLYSSKFDEDREAVMENARMQGVGRILLPNIDLESVEGMLRLCDQYSGICFPMMGLHPCSVADHWEQQLQQLKPFFKQHNFAAVGEIGLDLYWDKTTLDIQREALKKQLTWALEYDLPVVLHTRSAMYETVAVLKEFPGVRGVFHCFSESYELTEEIAAMGFYFGIGGVLTHKNSGLADAVKDIPPDRILLETDAPYLAPVPFRGKRNEPSYVWHVAVRLGEILGKSLTEIAELTTANADRLFFSKQIP